MTKKKAGRPRMFGKTRVTVRLTPAQAAELRLVRKELQPGAGGSDAVRHLLDQSATTRRLREAAGVPS